MDKEVNTDMKVDMEMFIQSDTVTNKALNVCTDTMDTIAKELRPLVNAPLDSIKDNDWDYAAGLFDADGYVIVRPSIGQALKGIDCLHYMHATFGGEVKLQKLGNEKHQTSFNWSIGRSMAEEFCSRLVDRLLLKKREMKLMLEFYKAPSNERATIFTEVKRLRHIEHDAIPLDIMPPDAYFGGFVDGEGCLDANGKNYQHHGINQTWRAICDVFIRRWGGTLCFSPSNNIWKWEIYTFADKFLAALAPFIKGKRNQVELIMNMQPGEGQLVHAQLRELKGNCTAPTPLIDKIQKGEGRVYKRPPKKLPKGVHAKQEGIFAALLKYEGTVYSLGTFPSIEQAQAQYDTYKLAVDKWKRGTGPPVDLEFNTRATQKANAPKPPPPETQLPTGVYLTQGNIYQARYTANAYGKKIHQLGTFKTIEEAVNARKEFETRLLLDGLKLTKQKRVFPDTRPVKLNA